MQFWLSNAHTHAHTHIHTHTYIHTHTPTYTRTHTPTYIYEYIKCFCFLLIFINRLCIWFIFIFKNSTDLVFHRIEYRRCKNAFRHQVSPNTHTTILYRIDVKYDKSLAELPFCRYLFQTIGGSTSNTCQSN